MHKVITLVNCNVQVFPCVHEKEYLTKDGRRIAVELLVHQFTDQKTGQCHYYSFITDISQRKKAEENRQELERRLADIIDFYRMPLLSYPEGRVVKWNRAIAQMTGIKAEDMIGKANYEYAPALYGMRRPMLVDLALGSRCEYPEYSHIRKEHPTLVAESFARLSW